MANHKSAKKRIRQTVRKTCVNKPHLTRARTVIKTLRIAIEKKDKKNAQELVIKAQSLLARTHLKKKTVARKTSRLAAQVAKL